MRWVIYWHTKHFFAYLFSCKFLQGRIRTYFCASTFDKQKCIWRFFDALNGEYWNRRNPSFLRIVYTLPPCLYKFNASTLIRPSPRSYIGPWGCPRLHRDTSPYNSLPTTAYWWTYTVSSYSGLPGSAGLQWGKLLNPFLKNPQLVVDFRSCSLILDAHTPTLPINRIATPTLSGNKTNTYARGRWSLVN